jgi:hypothetical protein
MFISLGRCHALHETRRDRWLCIVIRSLSGSTSIYVSTERMRVDSSPHSGVSSDVNMCRPWAGQQSAPHLGERNQPLCACKGRAFH